MIGYVDVRKAPLIDRVAGPVLVLRSDSSEVLDACVAADTTVSGDVSGLAGTAGIRGVARSAASVGTVGAVGPTCWVDRSDSVRASAMPGVAVLCGPTETRDVRTVTDVVRLIQAANAVIGAGVALGADGVDFA